MKKLITYFLSIGLIFVLSTKVFAQVSEPDTNIVATQDALNGQCWNTNLPVNVWTLVTYDNAGQPCATKAKEMGAPGQYCDPNTDWDWLVQGHVVFAPALKQTKVEVEIQLWAGNGGGSCYGGTTDPIFCDNPQTHYMMEDSTYATSGAGVDLVAPFTFAFYNMPPYFSVPSDENYSGFWLFAKPIGQAAQCKSTNYFDLGNN